MSLNQYADALLRQSIAWNISMELGLHLHLHPQVAMSKHMVS